MQQSHCLNTNYGIDVAILTFLPLGADINASVYKAETHNQTSYFVKLKYGHHHDSGVAIVELLRDRGIKETILPVKTILGQSTQRMEDFTLIVYPFIDGQNGFCCHLTNDQWVALGQAIKQVHDVDLPPSIRERIKKESYSSQWREAIWLLYFPEEQKADETALKLWAFIKEHEATIHRLASRAELLSHMIQKQLPKFVLCHSDIHGGNVLIDKSGAIYIVDWDEPIMAPKERDLMFIGGGVANVWNNPHEEELFYKGYENTDINKVALAYYRHERIVQDIVEYAQALLWTSSGGEDRLEMYRHFIDMFEANGVVDIAFKTDEGYE